MPHCAASGCSFQSKGNRGSDVSLHCFPTDRDRRLEWKIACGRSELPQDPRLCSRHFTPDCFLIFNRHRLWREFTGSDGFKRRLKPSAMPTIFSPKQTESPEKKLSTVHPRKRQEQQAFDFHLRGCQQPEPEGVTSEITTTESRDQFPQQSEGLQCSPNPDKGGPQNMKVIMPGNCCCVKNCGRRSHDDLGRKLNNGLSFYCFPAWRAHEGSEVSALTMRRRAAWVSAVGNMSFSSIHKSKRVCSRHFHSGKPAYEMLESDPDWVPSLELGHDEDAETRPEHRLPSVRDKLSRKRPEKHKRKEREKTGKKNRFDSGPLEGRTTGGGGGGGGDGEGGEEGPSRAAGRPWREVRALLLSELKHQLISTQHPANRTHQEAVHAGKEADFRDFFRESLRSSLENISRSRTLRTPQPPIDVDPEGPSIRVSPVKDSSKDSSSYCVNCVRLQKKVSKLKEELSLLSGGQEDIRSVSNRAPLQPDQVPQSPEPAQIEEEVPDWAGPLEEEEEEEEEEGGGGGGGRPISPKFSAKNRKLSMKVPTQSRPRFRKEWLSTFWFLRHSPSLNIMWCHVCRLYQDEKHWNKGMIRGSKCFKMDVIKVHNNSMNHQRNVLRYKEQQLQQQLDCDTREEHVLQGAL